MILGANHIAISVPDMDRAISFYCDLLGFQCLADNRWPVGTESADKLFNIPNTSGRVVHIGTKNLLIELFQFSDCEPQIQKFDRPVIDHGYTHLCLAVTDVDAEYERLSHAGMEFHCPPQDVAPGVRTVYGRDPFGNVLEFEESKGRTEPYQPPV